MAENAEAHVRLGRACSGEDTGGSFLWSPYMTAWRQVGQTPPASGLPQRGHLGRPESAMVTPSIAGVHGGRNVQSTRLRQIFPEPTEDRLMVRGAGGTTNSGAAIGPHAEMRMACPAVLGTFGAPK